jgi:hypothetical protein
MKKSVFLAVCLLVAASVFTQEFTFQGLPWGATREQVIAKLGEPNSISNNSATAFINIRFFYYVTLGGYNAVLNIRFHESKLYNAFYSINIQPFRDFDETQLNIAFLVLLGQLVEKYGAYQEIFTDEADKNYQYFVWHFDNFHIYISSTGITNTLEIGYCSNISWKSWEEGELKKMIRLPNRSL